ncbi:MAG: ankyrin repeat domain-containing protein [Pseudomonadota bacterium]|nr:ankyrin repeat domain-containing protein [Pseudomonadota bacterium]
MPAFATGPVRLAAGLAAFGLLASTPAAAQELTCQSGELFYSAEQYLGLATEAERDRFRTNALVQLWGNVTPTVANLANAQAASDFSGGLATSRTAIERALTMSAAERSAALAGRNFTVGRLNRVLASLEDGVSIMARLGPALGTASQMIDGVNILYHSTNAVRTGDRQSKALAIQAAMSLARSRLSGYWGGNMGPMMGMAGLLEYSINTFATDAWSRYEDYWWQAYVGYARERHALSAIEWAELYQREGRAGIEARLNAFWNDPEDTVDALGVLYNPNAGNHLTIARSAYAEAEYQRVFAARYMIEVVEPRIMQGFTQQADRLLDDAMVQFEDACEDALEEARAIDAALALLAAADTAAPDADTVLDAVFENDVATIREALAAGFDPNQMLDTQPAMPLMYGAGIYLSRDPALAPAIAALRDGGGSVRPTVPPGTPEPIAVPIGEGHEAGALALLDAGYRSHFSVSEGDTIIRRAVLADMPALVRRLIAEGHAVNVTGPDGTPLLLSAVNRGRADIVGALLDAGADPNERGTVEGAALHLAANRGFADLVPLLVAAGGRIDEIMTPGTRPYSPLMIAAMQGRFDAVRALVGAGADPAIRASRGTAADYARANGHAEIADYLDGLSGDVTVSLDLAQIPSTLSVSDARSATVVIREGWDAVEAIEVTSSNPGVVAITRQPDMFQLRPMLQGIQGQGVPFSFDVLAEGEASLHVRARTRTGQTVTARTQVRVARSPRELGDDIANAARAYDGDRIRGILAGEAAETQRFILETCARGVWPDCDAFMGGFAAMHMAYAGDVETLAALARTGASLDYVSNDGTLNTLIGAVTNGHGAAVDFLIGQGLDPDALTPSGNSAIVVAAARNNLALVQRLLAAGANPDRGALQDGTRALHHAAIHNNRAMIDALLNAGARSAPDGSGHAPGYYAFWLHQDENLAVRLGYGDARGYAERERRRNEPGFDWAEFARRMQPALEQTMGEIQTAQSQYNAGVAAANSNYDQTMAQAFRDADRLGQPLNALGNPPPYAVPSDAGLPSPYAAQQSSPGSGASSAQRPATAELPRCESFGTLRIFGYTPDDRQVHVSSVDITRDTLACRRGSSRFDAARNIGEYVTACGVRYLAHRPPLTDRGRFTRQVVDIVQNGQTSFYIDADDIEGGSGCRVGASDVPFMPILRDIASRGPM